MQIRNNRDESNIRRKRGFYGYCCSMVSVAFEDRKITTAARVATETIAATAAIVATETTAA